MKINGNGKASIFSRQDLKRLFESRLGFNSNLFPIRDKAIFGTCLYTACRISEALSLERESINFDDNVIVFKRKNTKGAIATREIICHPKLIKLLRIYLATVEKKDQWLFSGGKKGKHLTYKTADTHLRLALDRLKLKGYSTHSFRRTSLTQMHNAGVPLRHIQAISGHTSLQGLSCYLEVTKRDCEVAIKKLRFF